MKSWDRRQTPPTKNMKIPEANTQTLSLQRMMNRQLLRTMEMVRLFSSPQVGHSPRYSKQMGQMGALPVNRQMTPLVIKLNVMPESESDNGLPETQSKRKASEMDFEIPPAKRTEPAEGSTTESESDSDVLHSTRTPASTLISASSKGTITPSYHAPNYAHLGSS